VWVGVNLGGGLPFEAGAAFLDQKGQEEHRPGNLTTVQTWRPCADTKLRALGP